MKIPITLLALLFAASALNAQITLTENFEGSSAGSTTPPAGWSFVNKTGAPSYATSAAGQGSNGSGTSSGLGGRVSSTTFVDTNLAGGYLVNNTPFSLASPITGAFDFQLVSNSTFDDITFMLGNIADGYDKTGLGNGTPGEFLTVKLTEASAGTFSNSISNGYGRDQTVEGDRKGQLVTNNLTLSHNTWYRATVSWTPTTGTTGSFSIAISNFSSNVFTLTLPNFTFASANGHIGFGSVNDTIRFDNVSFSGLGMQMTTVPDVVGLAQASAESSLVGASLVVGSEVLQSSETIPAGEVISQSPVAGTSVAEGTAVNLVISSGPPPPPVTVPNVVGLAQAIAEANLLAANLSVGTVTQQISSTVSVGHVISQNPAGGTSIPGGTTVNLVVSLGPTAPLAGVPIISLNQIGYQTSAPKRFTAPTALGGQTFQIASTAAPQTVLFSGTISGLLGDFTAFQPASDGPYVISYTPPGGTVVSSYPFLIQEDLIQEKLVKPAIDFMIDSRSGVGTHPSAYGGAPWRDGTYYSFEVPSLIYLHLNARQTSNQKVGQINFNTEKTAVLAPSFPYVVETGSGDFLTELRRFYNTYDAPLSGCPDSLAAVHFGLGVTMAQLSGTKDPSGDPLPKHLHSQTREWFAWFLYAWPTLRDHLPDSFYDACRDFTFANWAASSGLADTVLTNNQPSPLGIDPLWLPSSYGGHDKHPFKGRHVPGHSILPNLLLWQVALREGRSDAATYLTAAQTQTQWIIDNLDWNDPQTTKGHRMSEYKMMTGLVHFLLNHPNEAPAGLAAKIEQWADVMISRSDNLWDFRRYELTDAAGDGVIDWSIPKQTFNWNEPGNLAGFPACALSAAWTLDHAPEKQQRLREMSQAAIDCLFGRNPLNTGSPARPQLGNAFPDLETSWTPLYQIGVAAYLETVRGSLSSGPASEHFPYNPAGAKRHPEGWVNFNAAFNMGLSYMLADQSAAPEPLSAPFPLIISEILAEPAGNALAEFIELHNPTSESVRLEGLTLSGDVSFTVPPDTTDLAPGGRCLIVRDQATFESTHGLGLPVIGSFTGDLDDAGAVLKLGDVNGNTFLALDRAGLPNSPGHSQTLGQSGWRISADQNGSPSGSDSITFVGEPMGDTNNDGVPNLIHHAVTGTDRAYIAPQVDLSELGTVVRVTRNLAADDTNLILEWSDDLVGWEEVLTPATITPSGDRLAEWTFVWPAPPKPFFIRLKSFR